MAMGTDMIDAPAKRNPQVQEGLAALEKQALGLRELSDVLLDRLGAVLRPSETKPDPNGSVERHLSTPRGIQAPFADKIDTILEALLATRSRLQDVLDRLEI